MQFLNSDEYFSQMLGLDGGRYKRLVGDVKAALAQEGSAQVRLALSLYHFKSAIRRRRTTSFFKYCSSELKLDRTQITRYIRVIEEFGNAERSGLAEEYTEYSFSLLLELLTIPKEERSKVSPYCTVKNVREFRRVLERKDEPDEEEEAPPSDRYIRFKKWKRSDLCEKILALEKELEAEKEINRKR